MFLIWISVFILGAIIGSFLNVVILRYNTGRSVNGRSGCLSCGYQLKWYDMVPIFSWLSLRGRCRKCSSKISIQYPLVEFGTAILFVVLFWSALPFLEYLNLILLYFIWNAIIFSILIVIFVYDIRHKIIPDSLSFTFALLALTQTLIIFPFGSELTIVNYLNLFAGPLLFLPFYLLWKVSSGRWIGLGDGKLALGIGWYLGFIYGLSAIIFSFYLGAICAITAMLIERLKPKIKNITMKTEVPFAPFLIIGIIVEFLIRIDLLGISLFF